MHTSNPRELSDYAVESGHGERTDVVWEYLRYGLDFNECAPSEGDDDKPHMHPSGQGRCTSIAAVTCGLVGVAVSWQDANESNSDLTSLSTPETKKCAHVSFKVDARELTELLCVMLMFYAASSEGLLACLPARECFLGPGFDPEPSGWAGHKRQS